MRARYDFGDFEITKREILASISIIAIMLLVGTLIASKVSEYQTDKNEIYNKALKINSKELFQHGMDTNIGNAFIYGDLEAVDTVTYPEIGGAYMSVKKVKERHTKHERIVTKTKTVNGKKETYTETETYWTWDEIDRWTEQCEKVTFLGIEFNYGDIYKPSEDYIATQKESLDIRYKYYGSPIKYTGTLFAHLKGHTIDKAMFYNNKTIDETLKYLESNTSEVLFWIIWLILTGACVFGFYYLDNKWLEN